MDKRVCETDSQHCAFSCPKGSRASRGCRRGEEGSGKAGQEQCHRSSSVAVMSILH